MRSTATTPLIKSPTNGRNAPVRSYSNHNLLKRLNSNNFEELCKAKKPADQDESQASSTVEEKYEELCDKVKELYVEFMKECLSEDVQKKIAEMPDLLHEGPLDYVQYIRTMIKMVAKTVKDQNEVSLGRKVDKPIDDYELVLQRAEADIKRHIRNEQQLKHLVDSMQARLDEYDRDKDNFVANAKALLRDAKKDNTKLIGLIRKKDAEIDSVNVKARQKEETTKSYEERLLSIPILEHKMKALKDMHAKEIEQIKQYYKQEFTNLTKEVQQIHKILSMNITIDEKIKFFEKELYTYKNFNSKKIQNMEDKLKHFDDSEGSRTILVTESLEVGGHDSTGIYPNLLNKDKSKIRKVKPTEMTRSVEEKSFRLKQQVMKKKAELTNEINMLSVGRVRDLNQELSSKRGEFLHPKVNKQFDNYFHHFATKLTQLNQLNEKEKETLRTLRENAC